MKGDQLCPDVDADGVLACDVYDSLVKAQGTLPSTSTGGPATPPPAAAAATGVPVPPSAAAIATEAAAKEGDPAAISLLRGLSKEDVAIFCTMLHTKAELLPGVRCLEEQRKEYVKSAAERCGGRLMDFFSAMTELLEEEEYSGPQVVFTEKRFRRFMEVCNQARRLGMLRHLNRAIDGSYWTEENTPGSNCSAGLAVLIGGSI